MRKGRTGHFQGALYLIDTLTLQTGTNQQAENTEAILLPESAELFDALVHYYYISSIIEMIGDASGQLEQRRCLACVGARGRSDLIDLNFLLLVTEFGRGA